MLETVEKSGSQKELIMNLLARMTDLSRLAEIPSKAERSGTFSSYDRASYYDEKKQCYVDWGANEDGDGIIREENGESVVVELTGPGVIWRTWSAQPQAGNINFYFDGEATPSYSRPFKTFFEQITDDVSPAGFPSVMPKLSGGYNSFFPIPFEKSLKITFSKGWGKYYHFTYSTYGQDEVLPSFADMLSKDGLMAMAELDRTFYGRGDGYTPDCQTETIRILPGQHYLISGTQSGAIRYLGAALDQIQYTARQLQDILRNTLLKIYWDQEEEAAINVPLGDFFGTAPGYNLFKTLANGITEKRLYANWFMPYSDGFRIMLENQSKQALACEFSYEIQELPKEKTDQLLRFHAKWHNGDFMDLDPQEFAEGGQRWPDWPLLLAEGAGRFCGVHMHIYDQWSQPSEESPMWWYGQWDDKTIDWWWGEGDEKFFVDGEDFPSTFGTGSEDYIGYAWAAEPPYALFDSAYAVQSLMPVDGNGHTSVMRLQICDNVPFTESFQAFIEKYKGRHWGEGNQCVHEFTPYWYQEKGRTDGYQEPTAASRNATLGNEESPCY